MTRAQLEKQLIREFQTAREHKVPHDKLTLREKIGQGLEVDSIGGVLHELSAEVELEELGLLADLLHETEEGILPEDLKNVGCCGGKSCRAAGHGARDVGK